MMLGKNLERKSMKNVDLIITVMSIAGIAGIFASLLMLIMATNTFGKMMWGLTAVLASLVLACSVVIQIQANSKSVLRAKPEKQITLVRDLAKLGHFNIFTGTVTSAVSPIDDHVGMVEWKFGQHGRSSLGALVYLSDQITKGDQIVLRPYQVFVDDVALPSHAFFRIGRKLVSTNQLTRVGSL